MNKAYTIVFEWSTEDANGVDVEVFDTYEKAVTRFNEIIETEQDPDMSWVSGAWDENGDLLKDYELDCNEQFTDGKEHELWWYIVCKNDWCLHDHLELRILEVK